MTTPQRGFKGGFRQSMSWFHTWVGLLLAVVLYFMFITGSSGYFRTEINRWMGGVIVAAPAGPTTRTEEQMIGMGLAHLAENLPEASYWGMRLPHESRDEIGLIEVFGTPLDEEVEEYRVTLDPQTGAIVEPGETPRNTGGGDALYGMHYALHYIGEMPARYIVGIATMFMLIAITTGIVVHKKIFADMFTFRPGKGQRSWLDGHNLASVLSLPFIVMITYSGLILYTYDYMPSMVAGVYGPGEEPLTVYEQELDDHRGYHNTYGVPADGVPATGFADYRPMVQQVQAAWGPGHIGWFEITNKSDTAAEVSIWTKSAEMHGYYDIFFFDAATGVGAPMDWNTRTASDVGEVLVSFHYGLFAGSVLRWLYFLSGLAGAAMIATGTILWTKKRRQAQRGDTPAHAGLRIIERLNAGVIIGLLIGIAVYFLSNRLIPLDLEGRADWEMNALFIAWGLMLLHALIRPSNRVWIEQLGLAGVLCAAIPVVNAFTSPLHLGYSLPAGDWVLAGFDLTMLAFAAAFAATLRHLLRRVSVASPQSGIQMEPAE
jgi:uncharacterized iron-regulated membrane protein